MENEPTNIFSGIAWFVILAQLINLFIIVVIVSGIIYFWRKVSRWNNERNQILHRMALELSEIKEELKRK